MSPRTTATKIICVATALTLLSACSEPPSPNARQAAGTSREIQRKEQPPMEKMKAEDKAVVAENLAQPSSPEPAALPRPRKTETDDGYLTTGAAPAPSVAPLQDISGYRVPKFNTESYTPVRENSFINTVNDPLSTFSIDVDTASYANVRRFINGGSLPPAGAVRLEEMVNYFSYHYPRPESGPFALQAEVGPAPWQTGHKLVKVGLQAKTAAAGEIPPSNLVFLIDVSGSMDEPDKLPLLQQSLLMLVEQLSARDRVSLVVYAGSERVVLEPTPGDRKEEIKRAISSLTSGGSTHGSSGIQAAYRLAEQVFMPQGNNRVILASDGDFNVGVTDRGELQKLIAEKRRSGIYLTVLGFGMGNYQDDTMEILADSGNGNYAYIDSLLEAKKVLIKERAGTLFTLARDVKIQVEFNPAKVGAYRLLGYENRLLADEDFRDDAKDAGEIGLGHAVTALYELIPVGAADIPAVDARKYQRPTATGETGGELMTVKLRYKPLAQDTSVMKELAVQDTSIALPDTSDDFRFAAAVAGFGMLLKGSGQAGELDYTTLLNLAQNSRGRDEDGYRAECIRLVEMAQLLNH